jgi:hypothetical protein
MSKEIEDIEYKDIEAFEKFLKLDFDYSFNELKENFIKYSRIYHPSIRDGEDLMFNKVIVAFEVLKFIYKKRKKAALSELIIEWNKVEKSRVLKMILIYKSISLNEFIVLIDKETYKIKTNFLYIFIIIAAFAIALFFIYQLMNLSINIFGIIYLVLFIVSILVKAFLNSNEKIITNYQRSNQNRYN